MHVASKFIRLETPKSKNVITKIALSAMAASTWALYGPVGDGHAQHSVG